VQGSGSKKFCHLMENIRAGKALHRAFSVFVFNSAGELLLQKRSDDKILFPKRWTNTCCSHPLYNEREMDDPPSPEASGVKRAVVRKLEHELGIPMGQVGDPCTTSPVVLCRAPDAALCRQIPEDSLQFMTRILYEAAVGEDAQWGEHEVDYILLAQANVDLDLNPNEVSEVRYLRREELHVLLEEESRGEIMLSPWFRACSAELLPKWWDAILSGKVEEAKDIASIHSLQS